MRLKGMTWDHPRGYEPMVATAREFGRTHAGVEIVWEKRSLQAFADFPVEQLAEEYDLIVIDHPHAGWVARHGCLVALDEQGREAELARLARESLGGSHQSYQYDGHQWALAIDAAAQVAAYRPDLMAAPPTCWDAVMELAREGRVLCPLKPVDALMSFFTLAANRGRPCRNNGERPLIEAEDAAAVIEKLRDLAEHLPGECLSMNPIEVYEQLSRADNQKFVYCPLGYGYTNYARQGFRHWRLRFGDIPAIRPDDGPRGSTLGGTGIAVSSRSRHIETAIDYAFWMASAECQRGLCFDAGGQPANVAAWDDDHCNAATLDFFQGTRRTLDGVYLRPRYAGYLDFQDEGGMIVNRFLRGQQTHLQTFVALEAAYEKSLSGNHGDR